MGFGEAIRTCLRKYATFAGRARRSEYWYFYLFTLLAGIVAGILDAVLVPSMGGASNAFKNSGGPIEAVLNLALLLPSIAVTVRRLHDTNHSGWVFGGFFLYLIAALIGAAGMGAAGVFTNAGGTANGAAIIGIGALVLIGIAYLIYLLVLLIWNGNAGDNKYGRDPKGPNIEVFS